MSMRNLYGFVASFRRAGHCPTRPPAQAGVQVQISTCVPSSITRLAGIW